jgi:hypothetical protein
LPGFVRPGYRPRAAQAEIAGNNRPVCNSCNTLPPLN